MQQIDRVVEVVEETLKGNTVRLTGQRKIGGKKAGGATLNLPKVCRSQTNTILVSKSYLYGLAETKVIFIN